MMANSLERIGQQTGEYRRGRWQRRLAVTLCRLWRIGTGGEGAWLFLMQQAQQDARSATATVQHQQELACQVAAANWTQYGFDAAHTNWSPCAQPINATNVARLTLL